MVKELRGKCVAVVVTHTDLDGLASGLLIAKYIEKYLGCDLKIFFAEPPSLSRILKSIRKANYVFISDLSPNRDTFEEIVNRLKLLNKMNVTITWFDHHIWERAWWKKLNELGVKLHINEAICTTGVVSDYISKYVPKLTKNFEWLIKATCSLDLWLFNDPLSPWLGRVVNFNDSNEWRYYVLALLEEMGGDLNKIKPIVESYVNKELRMYNYYLKKVKIIKLNGKTFVLVYKRTKIPNTSYLGHYLLSATNADVAVIIHLNSLSFRSRVVDVREIAYKLGGGGHKYAAGAPLKTPLIIKLLIKLAGSFGERLLMNYVILKLKEVLK